jgi:SAM-dependent methyltransferase
MRPVLHIAVALGFALSCASTTAPRSQSGEASVKPGINASFLARDLDVKRYTKRFEGESREVYALREQLADALELTPGDSVADVGAGTGMFIAPLSNRVGSTGRVFAVDIAPRFLEHLRARADREGLSNVSVVHAREDSVALPTASLDLAWVCDTYHHFEYPQSTLASLFRAIRPGGHLVLVDFHRVPGETPDWLLEHVRAGQGVFRAEIETAGFILESEPDVGLRTNYMLRFRRP